MNLKLVLIISGIFLGVSFGCKNAIQKSNVDTAKSSSGLLEDSTESILFISLKMMDDDLKRSVNLVSMVWSEGTLKNKTPEEPKGESILVCEFLNGDKKNIKSVKVRNPLKYSAEQFSPEGKIERKPVKLKEAIFSLRVEISKVVRYLEVRDEDYNVIGIIELS